MAHFYGTVKGQSTGEASRRGSKKSGLRTIAKNWESSVRVSYEETEAKGTIIQVLGCDEKTYKETVLWEGSQEELLQLIARKVKA